MGMLSINSCKAIGVVDDSLIFKVRLFNSPLFSVLIDVFPGLTGVELLHQTLKVIGGS